MFLIHDRKKWASFFSWNLANFSETSCSFSVSYHQNYPIVIVKMKIGLLSPPKKSKINFESSFLLKCYLVTIVNLFFGAFWSIIKEVKKWIYYCKSKIRFCPGKEFFSSKKILKRPKSLEYPLELGLGAQKPDFHSVNYHPP